MALTASDLAEARIDIETHWGKAVLEVITRQPPKPMRVREFLDYCTACGGDWSGMFLSGVRKLWPEVYDAIPDDMGHNGFFRVCSTIQLLGIDTSE